MNTVDDKNIVIVRNLFRTAILSVVAIFLTYIVGFLVPFVVVILRPDAGSLVQGLFYDKYSFLGVALLSSLIFWHWLKKYSKYPHIVMIFLYVALLLLMPLVDYQALLAGYGNILMVSLFYIFLSSLVYAIFNYIFSRQVVLAITTVFVILTTIWFYI